MYLTPFIVCIFLKYGVNLYGVYLYGVKWNSLLFLIQNRRFKNSNYTLFLKVKEETVKK